MVLAVVASWDWTVGVTDARWTCCRKSSEREGRGGGRGQAEDSTAGGVQVWATERAEAMTLHETAATDQLEVEE